MNNPSFKKFDIDKRKISDYCFNGSHPIGKHKARLFKSLLGFSANDTDLFISLLNEALVRHPFIQLKRDRFGIRYACDVKIRNFDKEAWVRTIWILEELSANPRLVTAYIAPIEL